MTDSKCLLDADPQSSPEAELAQLISDISEDTEFARWHTGVEFMAWRWVLARPPADFGRMAGVVRVQDVNRMRELSEQIGGWVHWREHEIGELDDDEVGVRFIPMDEWLKLYAEHGRR
jgi:hypothetical protein